VHPSGAPIERVVPGAGRDDDSHPKDALPPVTNNHAQRLSAQRGGAAMLTDEELRAIQASIRRITAELANISAVISKAEGREGHDEATPRARRIVDAGV
jgi:hypothetical protein